MGVSISLLMREKKSSTDVVVADVCLIQAVVTTGSSSQCALFYIYHTPFSLSFSYHPCEMNHQ